MLLGVWMIPRVTTVLPPCWYALQEEMSQAGLRTLCVAEKVIPEEEWEEW